MDSLYTVLAVTVVTIAAGVYVYCRKKLSYWTNRGVEQLPSTHWLFGDFKEGILFRSAPGWHLGTLYRRARRDVPFVGFYIFHKPCLLLRDPDVIKQILIKDFEKFSDRNFAGRTQKDSIGMKNLFGIRNPAWRYLRQKISPTLTKSKLKQMLPYMLKTGEPMVEYIEKQRLKEPKLDAQELSYKYATDLIGCVALGTPMDSFNNPNADFTQAVAEFFHGFKRMIALVSVFFMPDLVDLVGTPLLFNSSFVRKVFWEAVEERERTGEKRGDYIDTIVQLKNGPQNPLYEFSGENLLYQSGTFFSGFESSATTAAFTLMELARHPEIQQRARENIQQAVKEHGWTYEGFKAMKYLDQCVAEGVRLHPPVSTVDRSAKEDYKIPGTDIIIEKGTAIYISLYGLQGDPKHFDNPEAYDPSRFDEGRHIPDAYIPFGAGPRMCVGLKTGQLHAKVVLSMILSQFEVHQNSDQLELDPRSTFTAAAHGLPMEFKRIEKESIKTVGPGTL
ncbi:cytochrome P450 6k1-like [Cydia pomonella]|uniref:cytochrome P450 6k1-like n=1 Tax=Cydia pomonella TaxID=82600 RepID=UPI002ADE2881|nr:cytochrome P450 6k1-like [Cydia pomonella]